MKDNTIPLELNTGQGSNRFKVNTLLKKDRKYVILTDSFLHSTKPLKQE